MQDRRISAHQISASTFWDPNYLPDYGRLNIRHAHGSWLARNQNTDQWYQVDFEAIVKLIEIHTQGLGVTGRWVKEYTVSYSFHPDRIDSQFYQQNGQTKVKQLCFLKLL